MGKKVKKQQQVKDAVKLTKNERAVFRKVLALNSNQSLLFERSSLFRLLDLKANINTECGYPDSIESADYLEMYRREGVAKRVVKIMPEESWKTPPEIYETEKSEETEFEKAISQIEKERHFLTYLKRVDILSGIGRFGILIIGIDDGLPLGSPVEGINPKTGEVIKKEGKATRKLIYLKALSENSVTVAEIEKDVTSPRYGMPVKYNVIFRDYAAGGQAVNMETKGVHWTRVIHIADEREESETYGTPRMEDVYNRLMDIRKVLGGSAEMFWKGGFPGTSYEQLPEWADVTMTDTEKTALKTEIENYRKGLQRDLFLKGMTAKQLQMQVADPGGQLKNELQAIALTKEIPWRIFIGSEEARLASSEDASTWNGRVASRQNNYITPFIIRPFIDRLMAVGILPMIDDYTIDWPDLNTYTEKEKADVALIRTQAMSSYASGGANQVMEMKHFLTLILGFDEEEATAIEEEIQGRIEEEEVIIDEEKQGEIEGEEVDIVENWEEMLANEGDWITTEDGKHILIGGDKSLAIKGSSGKVYFKEKGGSSRSYIYKRFKSDEEADKWFNSSGSSKEIEKEFGSSSGFNITYKGGANKGSAYVSVTIRKNKKE